MTSKQRAFLRGIAANEDTIFQVGKGGIDVNFVKQVDTALEAREIVKMRTLNTYLEGPAIAAERLAAATNSEVVQVIGTKFVLYRCAKKPVIKLPD